MHQVAERFGIKTKLSPGNVRDEFSAGLTSGIKELLARLVSAKMCFILRTEKRRLMMIEPPRQFGRRRVLEIDNGILVTVEHSFVKKIAWSMQESAIFNVRSAIDSFVVKPAEYGRRSDAVKTMAMIENA